MSGITPLPDTGLPFFAYGALKSGEPAHCQIKNFLESPPASATIQGSLWVRDGLPLLKIGGADEVQGDLLRFSPSNCARAYETIGQFESSKHYYWQTSDVVLSSSTIRANVLAGQKLEYGRAVQIDAACWTVRDDPVFRDGLDVVRASIDLNAKVPFESAPPDRFDWQRFFHLQMSYLLLWSAIERYTALLLGSNVNPNARVKQFGEHAVFRNAFTKSGVTRKDEVADTRDPTDTFTLDPANAASSILYYYQVRNNLSHRGKGAYADGEIVRQSLRELKVIFDRVLVDSLENS